MTTGPSDGGPAGAYDGVLGVVAGFLAVDELRRRGLRPTRPVGVVAFPDEEGATFGVAGAGSRLLAGTLDPALARGLTDADGGNHAGTTAVADRRDPMVPLAAAVLVSRDAAGRFGAHATVGKVAVQPGGVNAVAAHADAWLDVRAADDAAVDRVVAEVTVVARRHGGDHGVTVSVEQQSRTPAVRFDGAGHDAGVLQGSCTGTRRRERFPLVRGNRTAPSRP